jgi:DNA-binding Xre family transcriptional regulator
MITWNLIPVLKARGIERPYNWLVKAGLSPHSAHYLLQRYSRIIRLDHVELLCEKLLCTPNELLKWTPRSDNHLSADHPLTKLKNSPFDFDLAETLKTASFEKLNEIKNLLSSPEPPPATNP